MPHYRVSEEVQQAHHLLHPEDETEDNLVGNVAAKNPEFSQKEIAREAARLLSK